MRYSAGCFNKVLLTVAIKLGPRNCQKIGPTKGLTPFQNMLNLEYSTETGKIENYNSLFTALMSDFDNA